MLLHGMVSRSIVYTNVAGMPYFVCRYCGSQRNSDDLKAHLGTQSKQYMSQHSKLQQNTAHGHKTQVMHCTVSPDNESTKELKNASSSKSCVKAYLHSQGEGEDSIDNSSSLEDHMQGANMSSEEYAVNKQHVSQCKSEPDRVLRIRQNSQSFAVSDSSTSTSRQGVNASNSQFGLKVFQYLHSHEQGTYGKTDASPAEQHLKEMITITPEQHLGNIENIPEPCKSQQNTVLIKEEQSITSVLPHFLSDTLEEQFDTCISGEVENASCTKYHAKQTYIKLDDSTVQDHLRVEINKSRVEHRSKKYNLRKKKDKVQSSASDTALKDSDIITTDHNSTALQTVKPCLSVGDDHQSDNMNILLTKTDASNIKLKVSQETEHRKYNLRRRVRDRKLPPTAQVVSQKRDLSCRGAGTKKARSTATSRKLPSLKRKMRTDSSDSSTDVPAFSTPEHEMQRFIAAMKTNSCNKCEKAFSSNMALIVHMQSRILSVRSEAGRSYIVCRFCGKGCATDAVKQTISMIQAEELAKSATWWYQCYLCEKKLNPKHPRRLAYHIYRCQQRFKLQKPLHLKGIHNSKHNVKKNESIVCDICDQCFTSFGRFALHIERKCGVSLKVKLKVL